MTTTLTRQEILEKRTLERERNLTLYQKSLEDKKKEEEQKAELERMKNRFYKQAFDKRERNHSKIE